jgi:hypothetical protein
VVLYTVASLAELSTVSLTEGGMLLFAHLVGGDYSQVSACRSCYICSTDCLVYRLDYMAVALVSRMAWQWVTLEIPCLRLCGRDHFMTLLSFSLGGASSFDKSC